MGWKRDGNLVTVSMSIADWELLLMALGMAIGGMLSHGDRDVGRSILSLTNRLNEGNPNFKPYSVQPEAVHT